ncbi:MAG TPA: CoA transferase, partial [Dehalococcoidia bacterium]
LLASEHLRERGFFREIDHPAAGPLLYAGPPARMSASPPAPRRAPLLGEHNADVYGAILGLRPLDLARLAAAGVI